jgi:hypothetical protein
MGICALPIRSTVLVLTHIHPCACLTMSVVMLPRRKHDVGLRDKRVCSFHAYHPSSRRKSERPPVRFLPDVIVAACLAPLCRVRHTTCGAHGDLSTLEYFLMHSLGEIGRSVYFRETYTNRESARSTFNLLCNYTCRDKMAVRSKAGLWGSTA